MKNEQELIVETIVKLDLWDTLKCLFGRCIKITTKVIVPQEQVIDRFNHHAKTEIVSTTTYFTKSNKPSYGYTCTGATYYIPKDEKN
jgi:hypothetical protein